MKNHTLFPVTLSLYIVILVMTVIVFPWGIQQNGPEIAAEYENCK